MIEQQSYLLTEPSPSPRAFNKQKYKVSLARKYSLRRLYLYLGIYITYPYVYAIIINKKRGLELDREQGVIYQQV